MWFAVLLCTYTVQDRTPLSKDAALEQSQERLRSQPLETATLVHIGKLMDAESDHAKARGFFALAARHSLRDVAAQAHVIDDMISAFDYTSALHLVDTVLRQKNTDPKPFFALIIAIATSHKAEQSVTEVLAQNPPWRKEFVSFAANDNQNPDVLYALFSSLKVKQHSLFKPEISVYLNALVKRQDIEKANFVWLDFLDAAEVRKALLIFDGGFSLAPRNQFFDWNLFPMADIAIGLVPRTGARNDFSLALDFTQAKPSHILVSQFLKLSAGDYVFAGEVNAARMQDDNDLRWEVRCLEKNGSIAQTDYFHHKSQWTSFEVSLKIPVENCSYQKLVLRSGGSESAALDGQIYFDNFSLTQASSNDG